MAAPAPELCRSRRMARLAADAMLPESTFRSRTRVLFSQGCSGRLAPEQGRRLREEIHRRTVGASRTFGDQESRFGSAVRVCSSGMTPPGEAALLSLESQQAQRFFVRQFSLLGLLGERLTRELMKERWLLKQVPEKV